MNKIIKTSLGILSAAILFSSCSKNNDTPTDNGNQAKSTYVLFTNEADLGTAGYMTAYSAMPTGNLTNITTNTLQMKTAFGFTKYGKWIFNRTSISGETGIQKLEVGTDGKINSTGFLANGAMFHIVNPTTGYYLDP